MCTATKAYLLDYLINEKGVGKLLYLDPDILGTAQLDGLYEKLEASDIVLTPHLDADYPDDGFLPDDGHIMRAGQFNLGFIGVNSSENAQKFLSWWKSKLFEKCVVDRVIKAASNLIAIGKSGTDHGFPFSIFVGSS